jgi:hypothetical protein
MSALVFLEPKLLDNSLGGFKPGNLVRMREPPILEQLELHCGIQHDRGVVRCRLICLSKIFLTFLPGCLYTGR